MDPLKVMILSNKGYSVQAATNYCGWVSSLYKKDVHGYMSWLAENACDLMLVLVAEDWIETAYYPIPWQFA